MEQIRLAALRDFAIQHLPRAQRISPGLPPDDYQRTLYGIAALINPNAPAIEQVAASLLLTVMSLSIEWGEEVVFTAYQRKVAEHQAVQAAIELCTQTGSEIPWLASGLLAPETTPLPVPPPTPPEPPQRPLLQPGDTQTTEVAARYLGVTAQYMRTWASDGSGPLSRIKKGRLNGWPTAELLRLNREGWKPRTRKKKPKTT